jgi:hypothetical protein
MQLIVQAVSVVMIVLNSLVIWYLNDLEQKGCRCAMDFRRMYIMVFTGVVTAISGINLILFRGDSSKFLRLFGGAFGQTLYSIVMLVAGVTNVVFIFQYIQKLRDEQCSCSESVYRDLLFGLGVVNSLVYGLLLFGALYVIILMASIRKLK